MKILHISSAQSWRGGEQQIAYLIEELDRLGHDNFLMHPFSAPIGTHKTLNNKCHLLPYKKIFSLNPLVALKINSNVLKHEIDVIHVHDSHAHTYIYLAYVLFKLDCPSVVSRRVDFSISKSSKKKYNQKGIKKIICVSDSIKQIMTNSLGTSDRLVTVHSGVDLNKFNAWTSFNLRKKYKIPLTNKIIANVSAIADHKDYPTFIATANELLKKRKDLTFLIIGGDGGERSKIVKIINEHKLQNSIILTGYIPDAYLLIPQFDIFLFPSKMEGLGTSILDAQVAGVPVVATNAGGIPEIIKHNETGLLCSIADSTQLAINVNKLLNSSELSLHISKMASNHVRQFSKKYTAEKTLAIYSNVI